MSIFGIKQRVGKLETAQDSNGTHHHVLEAFTVEEAEQKQVELITSGIAPPNDLFVVIRRFALHEQAR